MNLSSLKKTVLASLSVAILAACQPRVTSQPVPPAVKDSPHPSAATTPGSRADQWWTNMHEAFNKRAKQAAAKGDIKVIFLGDSITQQWADAGAAVWNEFYGERQAVNFGIGGDRTQHVLWRLEHGNVDGLAKPEQGHAPRLVVLMIGTNNSGDDSAEDIAAGIHAIVGTLRERLPTTKVLLLAIFPRGEHANAARETVRRASEMARSAADGTMIRFLDIGSAFMEPDGTILPDVMPDFLHLSGVGYRRWALAMEPTIREMLGEPTK